MTTARKLNFSDVFKMAKIIGKSGLKQDIINFFFEGKEKRKALIKEFENDEERTEKLEKARESMGVDFFFTLIEKAPSAEKEIYGFLGGLAEMKAEEIERAPISEIVELIGDVVKTNEDIADFFISALRSPTLELSTKS